MKTRSTVEPTAPEMMFPENASTWDKRALAELNHDDVGAADALLAAATARSASERIIDEICCGGCCSLVGPVDVVGSKVLETRPQGVWRTLHLLNRMIQLCPQSRVMNSSASSTSCKFNMISKKSYSDLFKPNYSSPDSSALDYRRASILRAQYQCHLSNELVKVVVRSLGHAYDS